MSLKKNILPNYISQIYVTVIGIVMVPLYLLLKTIQDLTPKSYRGSEGWGCKMTIQDLTPKSSFIAGIK
jgi:hypothetical protein